jgi:hypothetical protein
MIVAFVLNEEMTKKRKRIPSGGRRRDMSSMTDQHIIENLTTLKVFPNKELLILSTIFSIGKIFNLNTIFLIFIIFPFVILFSLQITTLILIEYENLKIVFKTIFSR